MRYSGSKKKRPNLVFPVTVVVDARERRGSCWKFNPKYFKTVRKRLLVGDYTIEGYEHYIAVERKSGFDELITNIGRQKWWRTKLQALSEYPISYIVVEDNFSSIARTFSQRRFGTLQPTNLFNGVLDIIHQYKIPLLFIGKSTAHRQQFLEHLFLRLVRIIRHGR